MILRLGGLGALTRVATLVVILVALSLGAAARAQSLPLQITAAPSDALGSLARGGIPVPGAAGLRDARTLKVVDARNGKEVAAAIRILARRPGTAKTPGAARWVQLLIPRGSDASGGYRLEVRREGDEARPPALALSGTPRSVKAGAVTAVLGDGKPVLISHVTGAGHTWAVDLQVTMLDEKGKLVRFAPGNATVEETSSAHLRLLWRGKLGSVLTATVRATFGLDVPWISVDIRLENPRNLTEESTVYLRELAVQMKPGPGMREGLDGTTVRSLPFVVNLSQSAAPRPRSRTVLKYSVHGTDLKSRGVNHGGVVGISDGKHALFLGNRHAAEENPTRFTVTPGRLAVHLLPSGGSGPHHRGRWGDPFRKKGPIDPRSLQAYRFEGSRWKTFTIGIWPTDGRLTADRARSLQHALESPPLVRTPGVTLTGEEGPGILIPTWSKDPSISEQRFRRLLAILVRDRDADTQQGLGRVGLPGFLARGGTYGGWNPYGWFNFGDIPWGNGYCSLHYDFPRTLFAAWLSSGGDRDFFDRGVMMTRHLRDIDYLHGGNTLTGRGAQRYEKGWWHGNAYKPMESHTWITGIQLHYLLTGDPGSRETLAENLAWSMDLKLENWDGLWGARRIGWPIDSLITHWMQDGDPRIARKIRALIKNFETNEKKYGSHGYVLNRGWSSENSKLPARHQSWMQAIVLSAISRYVHETGDRTPLPLVGRMARHLVKDCYIPPHHGKRGYIPASVYEFWAPGGYRQRPSIHLTWPLLDALARAALVLDDHKLLATSTEIFESTTRFFQWHSKTRFTNPDRARTFSPITARMTTFPASESKILSNIGRFGMAYLAVKRLMGK